MKVEVVINHTQTATIDIGQMPVNLIRDLLAANDGTFDGNWSLSDVARSDEKWTVDLIQVTELPAKGK